MRKHAVCDGDTAHLHLFSAAGDNPILQVFEFMPLAAVNRILFA